jgi:hypothetical protein
MSRNVPEPSYIKELNNRTLEVVGSIPIGSTKSSMAAEAGDAHGSSFKSARMAAVWISNSPAVLQTSSR